MGKILKISTFLAFLMLVLSCCKDEAKDAGNAFYAELPSIVSTYPADGASDLESESLVVRITYDMDMKVDQDKTDMVSVGDASILNVSAKGPVVSVFIDGLENGKEYTLHIPEGVLKSAEGGVAEEVVLTFSRAYHYVYNPTAVLTNRNADFLTRMTYEYLRIVSGRKMVSGVYNLTPGSNDFLNMVNVATSKYPAISGYDYQYIYASPPVAGAKIRCDYSDITKIRQHFSANGLVAFRWTWTVPSSESAWKMALERNVFDGYSPLAVKVGFKPQSALESGTWENEFLMTDLDEVAGYLKLLRDEGITVLWHPLYSPVHKEPLHDFWWNKSGAECYKRLWQLMYNLFTIEYGLDNLIWVWSAHSLDMDISEVMEWYPGESYVDVLGASVYAEDNSPQTDFFTSVVDAVQGRKLLAVTECGNLPMTSSWMAAGNMWSWFCVTPSVGADGRLSLSGENSSMNTRQYWAEILSSDATVARDEVPEISF